MSWGFLYLSLVQFSPWNSRLLYSIAIFKKPFFFFNLEIISKFIESFQKIASNHLYSLYPHSLMWMWVKYTYIICVYVPVWVCKCVCVTQTHTLFSWIIWWKVTDVMALSMFLRVKCIFLKTIVQLSISVNLTLLQYHHSRFKLVTSLKKCSL